MKEAASTLKADSVKNNFFNTIVSKLLFYVLGLIILLILYLISFTDFLLFHSIAEVFSIVIACGIFMVVWNSRQFIENNFFIVIGIAYLFIAFLDLLHVLAYKGIGIFPESTANLPTQLWISSRYLQSITILAAVFLSKKKIKIQIIYLVYFLITLLIVASIFYWKNFPTSFSESSGLTQFKKISEYVISSILAVSIYFIFKKKNEFDNKIFNLIVLSIFVTIISEMVFTLYSTPYGIFNAVGHLLKIIAFYLLYKAIIQTGLKHPYDLLFRELKQKEKALQLTRFSIDGADDLIFWIRPDCSIYDVNETTCSKLGFLKQKILSSKLIDFDKSIGLDEFEHIWNKLKTKKSLKSEHVFIDNESKYKDMEVEFNYVNFGKEEYCCAFARDITARKKAENKLIESEKRFRHLADNAPVLIWMSDVNKMCNYCNKTWLEFTGRTLEQELNDGWVESIHPEDKEYCLSVYSNNFDKRKEFTMEYRMKRKDNEYRWLLDSGVPRFTSEGTFLGYIGSIVDITEQKKYREQIETSLKEKVVLLKEIHHRVKNNLQVISSLFRLQSLYIKDKDAQNAFQESQNRVRSMALIHEKLYLSKNLSRVNLSEYVHELISNLLTSFRINSNNTELEIEIDDIELSVDVAINLGLIINELVSNTYKYAFPEGRGREGTKSKLSIFLKSQNDSYILIVKDNGIGLPENFDIKNLTTLGLQLVSSLAEQLNGNIKINISDGTEIKIIFNR